jgi:hypothetical protein
MVARIISGRRPALLAAAFQARDHELERREGHRIDLIEFATFALLVELTGGRLAHDPKREPFLLMLTAMTMKYRNPVLCRALFALAKKGIPL